MPPRSVASSLAVFVKLGALLLLLTAPSGSAFNSYLAGLKYYQLGNCLTNAPAAITDKPLDAVPESAPPTYHGMLLGDATSPTATSNDDDEYVCGGTLPVLLGEEIPDLVVTPAPALTRLSAATMVDEMAVSVSVSTSIDSSNDAEVSPAGGPSSALFAEGPSMTVACATGSISATVEKSVKSYIPFGCGGKKPTAGVPPTNAAGSGSYLDRLRTVTGGIEFSTTEASNAVIRYAFDVLDAPAVYISHYEGNIPSRRVIEKLGFVKTGLRDEKHARCLDGTLLDVHEYIMRDKDTLPPLDVRW